MAWNLPKAWSPGLALPGYVRAEGLQRRAFTTEWAPNGTYDNPDVGNNGSGFVQPKYVRSEGYGGGAYVTKWAPRGTYYGPKIPQFIEQPTADVTSTKKLPGGGYEYEIQSLSGPASIDEPMPEPFESFGNKASYEILQNIQSVPPKQRKDHLRTVLGKIDPTLYGRTQGIAKALVAHGMAPPQALGRGLAKALATGMAAELVNLGHKHARSSGRINKPAASGLLGLGCYGSGGSGSGSPSALGSLATIIQGNPSLVARPCLPNPPPGYTYDYSCPTGKKSARGTPILGCFRPVGPTEPVITKRGHNVCVTWSELQTNYHGEPTFMVGPFPIPTNASSYRFAWQDPSALAKLPPDWKKAIQDAFNPNMPGKDSANPQTIKPSAVTPGVLDYLNALGVAQPIDFNPIATAQGFQSHWWDAIPILGPLPLIGIGDALYQGFSGSIDDLKGPPQPIAQFKHPKTGDQWGGWIKIRTKKNGAPDPITNPTIMEIYFGKMPDDPWYNHLLDWIFWPVVELAVGIKVVAETTLAIVGALACAAVSSPGAVGGGMAAGGMTGGMAGAQAGAVGAQLAAAACGTPAPQYGQDSWILPLAVAGGLGLVAYVLTRPTHKKKPGTPGGTK